MSANESHHVIPLAPLAPRFTLLPVGVGSMPFMRSRSSFAGEGMFCDLKPYV